MFKSVRDKFERGFHTGTVSIYRNPKKVLLGLILLFMAMASGIPKISVDTSTEGFLHDDDPILIEYNEFRSQFGRDEMVQLTIVSDHIFSEKFMGRLKQLHIELEKEVPNLNEITSLINARKTVGDEGTLIVEDLLETWPADSQQWHTLKTEAMANPVYTNLLLSEDGRITTIAIKTDAYSSTGISDDPLSILEASDGFGDADFNDKNTSQHNQRPFLTDAENSELVRKIKGIVTNYQQDDFQIYLAGSPVVTETLKSSMTSSMARFVVMAISTIALILFLMFRRLSGVILPLLTVLMTVLSTVGLMSHMGIAIKLPTQILPSFLLAVGVGASVHLLAIFYQRLQDTQNSGYPEGNSEEAVSYASGHSGLPILMTSLTTAAGLASFSGSDVAPVSELGIFASMGVMISFVYTLVLTPTLLSLFKVKALTKNIPSNNNPTITRLDRFLNWTTHFSIHNSGKIIIASILLLAISLNFALQTRFSHEPFKWLPEDNPARIATEFVNANMKGASSAEIIIDSGIENGLYDPTIMAGLSQLGKDVANIETQQLYVGKSQSVADLLKEINKALNENREEFYTIPDDRTLIAQEFLLFENSGSDDLSSMVDNQFQKARFTAKMPWVDSIYYGDFVDELDAMFTSVLGAGVIVTVTGMAVLLGQTVVAAIYSMSEGYILAGGIITFMMIMLIGNVRIGLLSMIPNLAPIVVILGIMGLFDLPLDLFTMLIGSIAIGLAVDDTIHFMHNYRRYYSQYGDLERAIKETLHTSGRAMLVTTIVLSTGFFLYIFSSLNNLFNFGVLTGLTIIMALLSLFFLAPALLHQAHKYGLISDAKDY